MKKRRVLVLLFVLAVVIAAVSGVVLGNSNNASGSKMVTVTIQGDNRVYTSDTASIPFTWGTVTVGDNTKTVTVTNLSNMNLKAHLTVASPPQGWTLTFSLDNQLIPSGQSATGTLALNVPADTLAGNYNWGASITLERTKN